MLTKRYLATQKNMPEYFKQIVKGTAPDKFTTSHLKGLGFTSSNDLAIIPLLKDLGFLSAGGEPTSRYHAYRNDKLSKAVLGEALLEAYGDLFHINANPTEADREAIKGKFKSAHNVSDTVATQQAATFYALLKHADIDAARAATSGAVGTKAESKVKQEDRHKVEHKEEKVPTATATQFSSPISLRYNIEIHLPATKEVEVYNAIFKALKDHLT